jgi:DNA-binding transcriptional MerR regulator
MTQAPAFGIDELARRAAATVRTVRMYQERGLLPPPQRQGRTAVYGDHHLHRLQLVQRLSERGYSLAAIKELTQAWDAQRDLGSVLGLDDVLAQPLHPEAPRRISADELAEMFPADVDLSGLAKALEIGLLLPDGDQFIAPVPTMIDIGRELVESGVPLIDSLDVASAVLRTTRELAELFVSMFVTHVWDPFEAAGEPPADLATVLAAVAKQRPLAVKAVTASLAKAMDDRIDRAVMMDAEG